VTAAVLAFVPAAHAQRFMRSAGGLLGGYQSNYYGYGSPYSMWNPGYGYGGYSGTYGYANPGYYGGTTGYGTTGYYYPPSTYYSTPGFGYNSYPTYNYSTPTTNYATPSVAGVVNNQLNQYPNLYPPTGTVTQAQAMQAQPMQTMQTQSMYQPSAGTALITIRLPADAMLWVDDVQTTQTGPMRQFVTPGALTPGQTYHYTLKAQWNQNGQPVMRERKIDFQAGGQVNVDFTSGTEQ